MNDTFKSIVTASLPWITAALPGPLGVLADGMIRRTLELSPEDATIAALNNMTPAQHMTMLQTEYEFKAQAQAAGYANEQTLGAQAVAVITEVNKTMQVEASSEHWPSYSWRPFIGFSFGMYVISLWLLPLFKVIPVTMNPDMVLALGGILGVASWFRGKAQADVNNPIAKG